MCHEDKGRVNFLLDEINRLREVIAALKVYQGVFVDEVESKAVAASKSGLRLFPFRW